MATIIGYKRVSTSEQSTARQLDGMTFDRVYEDKVSGKDTNRPELRRMLAEAEAGDTIVVHSMDRLARNLMDLLSIVKDLCERGIAVRFVTENLDFCGKDNPMSMLLMQMMGAFAEFERSMIRKRQREGIAVAQANGVYDAQKRLTPAQMAEVRTRAAAKESKTAIAKDFGISRQTLYTYLRD